MSALSLNLNGKNVDVITIEDLGDRQRIFVGDVDSEIILKSSTGVKVQIGNKILDTGLYVDDNIGTAISTHSIETIDDIESNLSNYIGTLTDGQLIYDSLRKSLYIYTNGILVQLTNPTGENSFLSYIEDQQIDSNNKLILLKNAGLITDSLISLKGLSKSLAFAGISIYVISEKMEYCLVGDNPNILSNWMPTYLSSINGGKVSDGVIIECNTESTKKVALHVLGTQDANVYDSTLDAYNAIVVGDKTLSNGIMSWVKPNGDGYIELLNNSLNSTLSFVTKTGDDVNYPIVMSGKKVGINATLEDKFDTTIGGRTVFNNKVFLRDNVTSELFAPGFSGYGMRLGKDDYGYWNLDVDNLTVRQRMNVYELVVNQIKATNGSLWVSDGAKIKTANKVAEIPVYIKALYAGQYKKNIDNSYSLIPIEERPPYAEISDPAYKETSLRHFKLGFKYGDKYLKINNNLAEYVYPDYSTYTYDQNTDTYSLVTGTHNKDVNGEFIEAAGGEYILSDTIAMYAVTFDDIPPFFEGDLIRMQSWDPKLNAIRFARCQAGIQRNISQTTNGSETIIYVFENEALVDGLSLVRIGNNKDNIMSEFTVGGETIIREKTRGLLIPDAVFIKDVEIVDAEPNRHGAIYLTAADSGAPYIDIIDMVKSHNAFNPTSGDDVGDNKFGVMQTRLKARFGKLKQLVDLDVGLDGGSWQDYLYGIYTDSIFLKGNIVAQAGKIGDMFLKDGVLFTYNDGTVHTPLDFEHEDSTNQITAGGKINTNWVFNKEVAGVVLDGKKSRFSLGNKLNFENGVLTIDGNIIANGGTIAGWIIDDVSIRKDYTTSGIGMVSNYNNTGPIIFSGCNYSAFNTNRDNAKFYVDSTGFLKYSSGNIGGWTIDDQNIYKDGIKIIGDPVNGQEVNTRTGLWAYAGEACIYAGASFIGQNEVDMVNAPFSVNEKGYAKIKSGNIGGLSIYDNKIEAEAGDGEDSRHLTLDATDSTLKIQGVNNRLNAIFGKTNIWGSALYLRCGYVDDAANIGLLVDYSANTNKNTYGAIGVYSGDKIISWGGFYNIGIREYEVTAGSNVNLSVLDGNSFLIKATGVGTITTPILDNILKSVKSDIFNKINLNIEIQCKYDSTTSFDIIPASGWTIKNGNGDTLDNLTMRKGDHFSLSLYYNAFTSEKIVQVTSLYS